MKQGIAMLILSISGMILFQTLVVTPYAGRFPDGSHGELYGPIAFVQPYIYLLGGGCLLLGIFFIVRNMKK